MQKVKKKAFTLVELMVVIAIIAILAVVSVVGYTSFIKKESINSTLNEAEQVREIITSQVIASKDDYVTVKYKYAVEEDYATTAFRYEYAKLQVSTSPTDAKTWDYFKNDEPLENSFDAVIRSRFTALANMDGTLTIDGNDIWYHKVGLVKLKEYIQKNPENNKHFEPSQPFNEDDVAVNIITMDYNAFESSGTGGGDDPSSKISVDETLIVVQKGDFYDLYYTASSVPICEGGVGVFTVEPITTEKGTALRITGVGIGDTYLKLTLGDTSRAIRVKVVSNNGKTVIRLPMQNRSIPYDAKPHRPDDDNFSNWAFYGDNTIYTIKNDEGSAEKVNVKDIIHFRKGTWEGADELVQTELGLYQYEFYIDEKYIDKVCWSNTFDSEPQRVNWKIAKRQLPIPTQANSLQYSKFADNVTFESWIITKLGVSANVQEPTWNGLTIKDTNGKDYNLVDNGIVSWKLDRDNDSIYHSIMKIIYDEDREHIGYAEPNKYRAIFTINLTENEDFYDYYCWIDGNGVVIDSRSVEAEWEIHKILIDEPSVSNHTIFDFENAPQVGDKASKYYDNLPLYYGKEYIKTSEGDRNVDDVVDVYVDTVKKQITFRVNEEYSKLNGFRNNEYGDYIVNYDVKKHQVNVPTFKPNSFTYEINNKGKAVEYDVSYVPEVRNKTGKVTQAEKNYFNNVTGEDFEKYIEIVKDDTSTYKASEAGEYSVVFKLKHPDTCEWTGQYKGEETISVTWKINRRELNIPTQKNTLTYTVDKNGPKTQKPTWNYDDKYMVVGDPSGADARTYTATFNTDDNCYWLVKGNEVTSVEASWIIGRATIDTPKQINAPRTDGSNKSPEWDYGTGAGKVSLYVNPSGSDPSNEYEATFNIIARTDGGYNYQFENGSTSITVNWAILKREGFVVLSQTGTQNISNNGFATCTVTSSHGGTLTVNDGGSSYCDASISGTTITVTHNGNTGKNAKTATITVTCAGTDEYEAATASYTVYLANSSCVTGDTLVLMGDGTSEKQIKDLKVGDVVMTWNMIKGEYEAQPVNVMYNHGSCSRTLHIKFNNNKIVKIVGEHGFFDYTLNTYVYINENNYSQFIGHEFVTYDNGNYGLSILESAEIVDNVDEEVWSLQTAYNENFVTESMLSITQEYKPGRYEYFEFGEGIKWDKEKMQNDIEKYGLFTYDEWKDFVSEKDFYEFNGPWFKILIGKGIINIEDISDMIDVTPSLAEEDN